MCKTNNDPPSFAAGGKLLCVCSLVSSGPQCGGVGCQHCCSAGAVPGELTLATTLRVLARMRAAGDLLRPVEWAAYESVCGSSGTAARFAVAAALHGAEVRAAPTEISSCSQNGTLSAQSQGPGCELWQRPLNTCQGFRCRYCMVSSCQSLLRSQDEARFWTLLPATLAGLPLSDLPTPASEPRPRCAIVML